MYNYTIIFSKYRFLYFTIKLLIILLLNCDFLQQGVSQSTLITQRSISWFFFVFLLHVIQVCEVVI